MKNRGLRKSRRAKVQSRKRACGIRSVEAGVTPADSEVRSCARHGRHYRALRRASRRLFAEDFLDVANFALNFSAGLFDGPAIFHVPVASGSSCFLFHVAFNFLRRALE